MILEVLLAKEQRLLTLQLTTRILSGECFDVFVLKSGCPKSGKPLKGLCFVIRWKGRHCDWVLTWWVLNWRVSQAESGWEGGDQEWGIGGMRCQSSEGIGDSSSRLYSFSCLQSYLQLRQLQKELPLKGFFPEQAFLPIMIHEDHFLNMVELV